MKPRIYHSESQKALMWARWKRGASLLMIAQLFDHNHSSIQRILAEAGGIRPTQPSSAGFDAFRTRRNISIAHYRRAKPRAGGTTATCAFNNQLS